MYRAVLLRQVLYSVSYCAVKAGSHVQLKVTTVAVSTVVIAVILSYEWWTQ